MVAALVDLAACKAHVRKTTTDEDAIIATYRLTAISWVENYTGHILAEREVVQSFTEFGDYLTIHAAPNVVIDSIAYVDSDGDVADFAYFAYPSGVNPVKIYPDDTWPEIDENTAIAVTYTAGYETGEVPDVFNQAVLVLVAAMHMTRGSIPEEAENTCRFLLRAYRGAVLA